MILELIIIILLIYVVCPLGHDPNVFPKKELQQIAEYSGHTVEFDLIPDNRSYTVYEDTTQNTFWDDVPEIHLATNYNRNSVIRVGLHELAHVITKEPDGSYILEMKEQQLVDSAVKLGIIDPNVPVESNYPCELTDSI